MHSFVLVDYEEGLQNRYTPYNWPMSAHASQAFSTLSVVIV